MITITANKILILLAAAVWPVLLAFGLYIAIRKFRFWGRIPFIWQQVIIGSIFAASTILAFYFGVQYEPMPETGVQIVGEFGGANASPMIAGLVFGWPAGIISGFIASLYRLFMHPFGSFDYLRVAECVCILISGCLAALLRKGLFDDKKPKWGYGIIIGILIETFHMLLIFVTGMAQKDVDFAYAVILQCDIACAIVVVFAVVASLLVITIYEKERIRINFRDNQISTKVQRWMVGSFAVAILITSLLTYMVASSQSSNNVHNTLVNGARDTVYELETAPYGNPAGWDIPGNPPLDPVDPNNPDVTHSTSEIKSIAYTRRIGTNGFIVISGVGSNYESQKIGDPDYSPINIQNKVIYSISADLQGFLGKKMEYREKRDTSREFIPNLTDNVYIDTVKGYENHATSPTFEAAVQDATGSYYQAVGVRMYAIVTGDSDKPTQYYNVDAIMSQYEAQQSLGLILRVAIYLELLVLVGIYGIIYTFIKRAVVQNIQKINKSLAKITEGDLSVKINVRNNAEFASLSDDINQTVDVLKGYIEEAKKRMEQELVFAKTIQNSTLPYIFPTTSQYDLYADMKTAKQVGGDFYDFFTLTDNRLFFLIADVSGKGVPAAMFMMRAETLIKSLVQTNELSLDQIMSMVNDELCSKNEAQMFVTCWCAILDLNTGKVEFVNAGHNLPLLKKKGDKFVELHQEKNFVLAGMENIKFKLEEFTMKPGDELLVYTDGVTEATSKNKELYGINRLLKLINEKKYSTSHELVDIINSDLEIFQRNVDQADDITMLMIRYEPNQKK